MHIWCPQDTEIIGRELTLNGASVPTRDTGRYVVFPGRFRFPDQLLCRQLKILFCSCFCALLTSPSLVTSAVTLYNSLFQSLLGFFNCLGGLFEIFLACVVFASQLGLSIVYFTFLAFKMLLFFSSAIFRMSLVVWFKRNNPCLCIRIFLSSF